MSAPRIGIVGAGRTRNGLGPFLAGAFERAGCRVVGVAGRDPGSAAAAAQALGARLGHAVAAAGALDELCALGLDALVVAAPVAAHLAGLEAALAAGLPCLCEKPLVAPAQTDRALALVAEFAARGLLLFENCQWPYVLPAFDRLFPGVLAAGVAALTMRMSPSPRGQDMILDSLSHVLSMAQAVAAPDGTVAAVAQEDPGAAAERNTLRCSLPCHGRPALAVEFVMARCPEQPRPAWFALDGHRVDRRLGAGYGWSLVAADGRAEAVTDPLHALVYRFATLLTSPCRDQARTAADAVAVRLRLFHRVVAALG